MRKLSGSVGCGRISRARSASSSSFVSASRPSPLARSSTSSAKSRPITAAAPSSSRLSGESRASRRAITSFTAGGIALFQARDPRVASRPSASSMRTSSRMKNGLPSVRSQIASTSAASGSIAPAARDQPRDLRALQTRQRDPLVLRPARQLGERLGERRARRVLGSVGADDQHARLADLVRDEREQAQRRSVGPVEIVEQDDQRLALRGRAQEPRDPVVEAEARLRPVEPRRALVAGELRGELGHEPRDLLERARGGGRARRPRPRGRAAPAPTASTPARLRPRSTSRTARAPPPRGRPPRTPRRFASCRFPARRRAARRPRLPRAPARTPPTAAPAHPRGR